MNLVTVALVFVAAPAAISAATLLPYQEFSMSSPSVHAVLTVDSGQIPTAISHLSPLSTNLYPAEEKSASLMGGSGDPFEFSNGRATYVAPGIPAFEFDGYTTDFAVIAETYAGTSAGVTLYVGIDGHGDHQPHADDQILCQSVVTGSNPARCVLAGSDLQHYYWAMAVAPDALGANYTANFGASVVGIPQFPPNLPSLTGPDHVASGEGFSLRLSAGIPGGGNVHFGPNIPAPSRYYGAAFLKDADDSTVATIPYSINWPAVADPSAYTQLIAPGWEYGSAPSTFYLAPGQSMRRLFFDLPPSSSEYDSISIDTYADSADSAPYSVEFSLVRAEFPAASSEPSIIEAPLDVVPAVSWKHENAANQLVRGTLPHPQSGRWYIVATNRGSVPVTAAVTNVVDATRIDNTTSGFGGGANPLIAPGQYFNPQRPGHGISIGRGGDQQVLMWYSYIEDGTPVWYLAQAASPAADTGWWMAPLLLATWNGQTFDLAHPVGYVELVPTATNKFMFTWQLEGQTGSEAFEMVAPNDQCPRLNGALTNLSGSWYPPAQPGSGIDVLALSDHQADIFYLYDGMGQARWLYTEGALTANDQIALSQLTGFCPTCAFAEFAAQRAGEMRLSFADYVDGALQSTVQLQPPLSGTWDVTQPITRLTGITQCSD